MKIYVDNDEYFFVLQFVLAPAVQCVYTNDISVFDLVYSYFDGQF